MNKSRLSVQIIAIFSPFSQIVTSHFITALQTICSPFIGKKQFCCRCFTRAIWSGNNT